MPSVIDVLEQRIIERIHEAQQKISVTGDADAELDAVLADIHAWCLKTEDDVREDVAVIVIRHDKMIGPIILSQILSRP